VGDLADELNVGVYVVGGFVRDLILGKANDDIDLVVEEDGIAFADALAQVSCSVCNILCRSLCRDLELLTKRFVTISFTRPLSS
jgi:tRNA nucleotidyltransferase/poly(A) polymerase